MAADESNVTRTQRLSCRVQSGASYRSGPHVEYGGRASLCRPIKASSRRAWSRRPSLPTR